MHRTIFLLHWEHDPSPRIDTFHPSMTRLFEKTMVTMHNSCDAVQELNRALTMAGLQEPKLAPQRSTLVSCHQHWHLVLGGLNWSGKLACLLNRMWTFHGIQLSYRGFIGHFGCTCAHPTIEAESVETEASPIHTFGGLVKLPRQQSNMEFPKAVPKSSNGLVTMGEPMALGFP